MNVDQVVEIKKDIERMLSIKNQLLGQREQLLKDLKNYGVSSVDEAKTLNLELEKKIEGMKVRIETWIQELLEQVNSASSKRYRRRCYSLCRH
jgi:predicted component of type VI protein secretion system